MKKLVLASLALIFAPSFISAGPYLTRPAPTVGFMTFETGLSVAARNDKFRSPERTYQSVNVPIYVRLGIMNKLDLGFTVKNLSHSLDEGGVSYKGSLTSVFVPEIKWALWDNFSLLGIYTPTRTERESDTLPLGRGNDFELVGCYTQDTAWPLHFNLGYFWRGRYKSHFGDPTGPVEVVEPGNILEAKGALQIPLPSHFSIITEMAYYYVDTMKVAGNSMNGTAGSAMDALAGLDWEWKGLNLGVEAGFGLLKETHTSFEIERGCGDYQINSYISYRLLPWWLKK